MAPLSGRFQKCLPRNRDDGSVSWLPPRAGNKIATVTPGEAYPMNLSNGIPESIFRFSD